MKTLFKIVIPFKDKIKKASHWFTVTEKMCQIRIVLLHEIDGSLLNYLYKPVL